MIGSFMSGNRRDEMVRSKRKFFGKIGNGKDCKGAQLPAITYPTFIVDFLEEEDEEIKLQ